MPGVDPLAVTNDEGCFEIVTAETVDALDLQVSSRATATKKFLLVLSGNADNRLQLSEGATVEGRLLDHDQPVSGVLVGLVQADRKPEDFLGPMQIGTNDQWAISVYERRSESRLLCLWNHEQLASARICAAVRLTVAGDRTKANVGDLKVGPAFHIAGRIALSDGKPLPAHTRVLFSREDAWDSQTVQADADGKFTVDSIPQGRDFDYSLAAEVSPIR